MVYVSLWQHASRFDPTTQHELVWLMAFAHQRAVRQIWADGLSRTCPHSVSRSFTRSTAADDIEGPDQGSVVTTGMRVRIVG